MKTFNWTLSQLIGLGMLILFAFLGWCGFSYMVGHMRGANSAMAFIMANGSYIKSPVEGKQ